MVNNSINSPIEQTNALNESIEQQNFYIFDQIDNQKFKEFVNAFWTKKEENKVLISEFLDSTKINIAKIWDIKVSINHIKNFVQNETNPEISKDLQNIIAKIYLKKLYNSCIEDDAIISKLNNAFNIDSEKCEKKLEKQILRKKYDKIKEDSYKAEIFLKIHDITLEDLEYNEDDKKENILKEINAIIDNDSRNIDFKAIQIAVNKLWNTLNDKLNSITVTNNEIFDSISEINKICNFESQTPSSQGTILDLLQFETKRTIDAVKSRWKIVLDDAKSVISPKNTISELFDKVQDGDIKKLALKRAKLEDILSLWESWLKKAEKTVLEEQINDLKTAWFDDDYVLKVKKLLLWEIDYKVVKDFFEKELEIINKQIWRKYIDNFEKSGVNPEFVYTLKKLYLYDFDCSKLDKKEQTILWQNLIVNKLCNQENSWMKYTWLDAEEFKSFLKDVYDFEKNETSIKINGDWTLKLNIKKEVVIDEELKWWIKSFKNPDKFKNMDIENPIRFTVNLDGNDEQIIKVIEETKDSPLRASWIMETHMIKWKELDIWNWYKLEICGKTITKSQLDELLHHSYANDDKLDDKMKAFNDLNVDLARFWLYNEVKDLVNSLINKMLSNHNWEAQNNNQWQWQVFIFEEIMKDLDVKVLERNLILDWQNVDQLSKLYLLAKLWSPAEVKKIWENANVDEQVKKALNCNYWTEENETWTEGKEEWEKYADNAYQDIKWDYKNYDERNSSWNDWDDGDDYDNPIIQDDTRDSITNNRKKLNSEWKEAFKEKLSELCNNDPDFDDDIKEEVDELIRNLEGNYGNESLDEWWESWEDLNEQSEKDKFNEVRKSFGWDSDVEFVKGARIYADIWESKLPPHKNGSSYFCFEIDDIWETTFTLKPIWWDLKCELNTKYTLPKTSKQLEAMKSREIFKVRPRTQTDWEYALGSLIKAKRKITAFGNMEQEWQVRFDWDKFVKTVVNESTQKPEEVEVKYFSNFDSSFDDSNKDINKRWQWESICTYEIKKINKSKWTVTVAWKFDEYDRDKDYKKVRYDYENEMTFEQFILLVEWKQLKWKTKEQQKELETRYEIKDPKRQLTRSRISLLWIKNVFDSTIKGIQWKIKEHREDQEENFKYFLFSKEWLDLHGKIWWLFWDTSLWRAFRECQYEVYVNRDNRIRKKIEKEYKLIESEVQFSELLGDHLINTLSTEEDISHNEQVRYKFAAALLLMVKKEWAYPRMLSKYKDKWKWVYNMLWKEHRDRFLNFYERKKQELELAKDRWCESSDRLERQEELNKMEIKYIISVIDWRAPYGQWAISNEYEAKGMWSKKFALQLEENMNWYYNKHEEEKGKLETFFSSEEAYLRHLKAAKFGNALPALERMCETARTPAEVFLVKWYLLGAMLMWIVKNNATVKTIKSFRATCRWMWFTPWYRIRDVEQQDKVTKLLDWITNRQFSKDQNLKFNVFDFEPGHLKDTSYSFGKRFQSYWKSHWEDILHKIENPTYKNKDIDGDKSIIDLANEKDNPNNQIFKDIIKNSTTNDIDTMNKVSRLFAQKSPLSATKNMVKEFIPSRWDYNNLKSEEDKDDAVDFWNAAKDEIPTGRTNKEAVDFIFNKFFNRFDTIVQKEDQKLIARSLPLIKRMYNKGYQKNAEYMLWYVTIWCVHEKVNWDFPYPFKDLMEAFFKFFMNNIDQIDKNTVDMAFDPDVASGYEDENVFEMANWQQYNNYIMHWYTTANTRNNYRKLVRIELHKKHKEEDDLINDKINNIYKRIKDYNVRPRYAPTQLEDAGITVNTKLSKDEIRKMEEDTYWE